MFLVLLFVSFCSFWWGCKDVISCSCQGTNCFSFFESVVLFDVSYGFVQFDLCVARRRVRLAFVRSFVRSCFSRVNLTVLYPGGTLYVRAKNGLQA